MNRDEKPQECPKCGQETLHRSKHTYTSFRCLNSKCRALFDESEVTYISDFVKNTLSTMMSVHEAEMLKNNLFKKK